MKIGDRIFVRGYIDEIRKDTVIVRNDGGYFGTVLSEVTGELPSAQPDVPDTNVGDMISRQAAMEMLMAQNVIMDGSEYHNGFNAGVNRAQEIIRNLPPVQPKQMNGEWNKIHWKAFRCSECNRVSEYHTNFCPNCGADMRCSENPNS